MSPQPTTRPQTPTVFRVFVRLDISADVILPASSWLCKDFAVLGISAKKLIPPSSAITPQKMHKKETGILSYVAERKADR
jgi:hypothetical protein